MSTSTLLAFGLYPYIALTVMIVATWIRYDREQYTWKAGSSQLLEHKWLRRGSAAFHVGIIGIFFGHLVGLLTPASVFYALGISAAAKQLLAIVAGGLFGLLCFYGLTILVLRRLLHPRVRASSSVMDTLILLLLYAQLLLGLSSIVVSLGHLDGKEMIKFMTWAQGIFTLQPVQAAQAVSDVHWIFKAHLVLGMTIFLLFPFTRLVHILSLPVKYFSRNYQVVRQRRRRAI